MDPSSAHGLNVEEDGLDRLLAHLLHDAHGSRPEEHLGVAEPDKKRQISEKQNKTLLNPYLHLSSISLIESKITFVPAFKSAPHSCTSFGLMIINR